MSAASPYTRTWPQRLGDAAPYFGLLVALNAPIWLYDLTATSEWLAMSVASAVLVVIGAERSTIHRQQRDTYRRLLVEQVRDCGQHTEGRADRFEHLPADVLAEAFPPANRKEADNDL